MCHAAGQAKSDADPAAVPGPGTGTPCSATSTAIWCSTLQAVIDLKHPGVDDTGGEFLLYEQRPRAQTRGTATLIPHGHGLVFTTRDRPVESRRGWSAAPVRHGVSAILSGRRITLALVFHDAT